MINLLPPETKEMYTYARRNHTLMHWAIACIICLAGGAALAGGGYLYLNRSITQVNQHIDSANQQLSAERLSTVKKQVTTISNNLKLTVQVLSQEILFSKLLKQLASVTPNNAVLTGITFAQTQSGMDITAQTTDYAAATQLQVNLADPKNQIFSKADIVSIACTSNGGSGSRYPCTVTLRALFAGNNPYLFINDGKKGAK